MMINVDSLPKLKGLLGCRTGEWWGKSYSVLCVKQKTAADSRPYNEGGLGRRSEKGGSGRMFSTSDGQNLF